MLFKINIFLLFILAPFLGLGLAYARLQPFSLVETDCLVIVIEEEPYMAEVEQVYLQLSSYRQEIEEARQLADTTLSLASLIRQKAYNELEIYRQQQKIVEELIKISNNRQSISADMHDYLLANMLGDPIGQTFGKNATVKVYSLEEVGYRGYMAKVRLHNLEALKLTLAEDKVASLGETTSAAAKRSGGVLAVNAGGFFFNDGKLHPVGITVVNGEILTFADLHLSFVGFNRRGQLVGGVITSREQLAELDVLHGASFLPTLLKNGVKQPIPSEWADAKHPRTLIGHFKNDDILFVVIDGRREGWSMGVTLEEAQDKLLELNVRDAYNLDGGGSSTFYYNGRVLNRPSDGSERRVKTNFVIIP